MSKLSSNTPTLKSTTGSLTINTLSSEGVKTRAFLIIKKAKHTHVFGFVESINLCSFRKWLLYVNQICMCYTIIRNLQALFSKRSLSLYGISWRETTILTARVIKFKSCSFRELTTEGFCEYYHWIFILYWYIVRIPSTTQELGRRSFFISITGFCFCFCFLLTKICKKVWIEIFMRIFLKWGWDS